MELPFAKHDHHEWVCVAIAVPTMDLKKCLAFAPKPSQNCKFNFNTMRLTGLHYTFPLHICPLPEWCTMAGYVIGRTFPNLTRTQNKAKLPIAIFFDPGYGFVRSPAHWQATVVRNRHRPVPILVCFSFCVNLIAQERCQQRCAKCQNDFHQTFAINRCSQGFTKRKGRSIDLPCAGCTKKVGGEGGSVQPRSVAYFAAAFLAAAVTSLVAFFTAAVASSVMSLPAAMNSSTVSI